MEEDRNEKRRGTQKRAREMGHAFVDLDRVAPAQSTLDSVSRELVVKHSAIPLKKEGVTLFVAMAQVDVRALDEIRQATQCRIIPVLVVEDSIREAIKRFYPV